MIEAALAKHFKVSVIRPVSRPKRKLARLLQMVAWDFMTAPHRARQLGASTIIHATNTGGAARGVGSVLVLHDTMVLDHPKLFDRWYGYYARLTFGISVRAARLIVTPSRHSADRVIARWPFAAGRVVVIPWPAVFLSKVEPITETKAHDQFVLVVSSMDKHKRLGLAIDVVARMREVTGMKWRLLMVVRSGNDEAAVLRRKREVDPDGSWIDLRFTITDEELADLYVGASMLLVPSIDEGYCLPAVEALAHGTPVAHAGRGALSEVVPLYPPARGTQNDLEVLIRRALRLALSRDKQEQLAEFADRRESLTLRAFSAHWVEELRRVGLVE